MPIPKGNEEAGAFPGVQLFGTGHWPQTLWFKSKKVSNAKQLRKKKVAVFGIKLARWG